MYFQWRQSDIRTRVRDIGGCVNRFQQPAERPEQLVDSCVIFNFIGVIGQLVTSIGADH